MPLYEYECKKCGAITIELHNYNEHPKIVCEQCNSTDLVKIVSNYSVKIGKTIESEKKKDLNKKNEYIKKDLKENYGIEKINPIRKTTLQQIYKDVKSAGNSIQENMQMQREHNQKKTKEKQREWMKGALKRTPRRAKERREKRAEEEYNNRKIDLR